MDKRTAKMLGGITLLKIERISIRVPELKEEVSEEILQEYKTPFLNEVDIKSYQFGYKVALANLGYKITGREVNNA